MKQIFFDKNQSVFIKVFPSSHVLEREMCGIKVFKELVNVPNMEVLDTKVAKITLIPGFLGYQITETDLSRLVAKFLMAKILVKDAEEFSIFQEIKFMRLKFRENQELLEILREIEQGIMGLPLYPVHGDLQKQNIVITGGQLGLIDFEHFMFAPKELEICNSLFFNDGNCLDIQEIINFLPKGFIDKSQFRLMLKFYTLRQISLGMDTHKAFKRLERALVEIGKLDLREKKLSYKDFYSSFCYI